MPKTASVLIAFICSLVVALQSVATAFDDNAVLFLRAAATTIDEFHAGSEKVPNVIRLVYFHPRDREPLANWRERLNRSLSDISKFYRDEFARFGLAGREPAFEKNDQGFAFHVVRGDLPAAEYDYDSGTVVRKEIREALAGRLDIGREHVLAIHGLCHKAADGRYVFRAPYYGGGTQRNGFCHAADCELLDSRFLSEKKERIVYTEHYYPRVEQTLGKFNSWYLGGITHELGHGLGLPHDKGSPAERSGTGHALMGSGNLHYRENLWGGKHPSYLSTASTLRLLSSPLVTRSNRLRSVDPEADLPDLTFDASDSAIKVSGTIETDVPAYAVIAYLWRPKKWPGNPGQDHSSLGYPALMKGKRFQVKCDDLKPGDYRLRLAILHCNGAVTNSNFHLMVDDAGRPNASALRSSHLLKQIESAENLAREAAARVPTTKEIQMAVPVEVKGKLKVLRDILKPPEPISLSQTEAKSVVLSDAEWVSAKVGWSKVARNYFDTERQRRNSIYLELRGKFYNKGLYAHSPSAYEFVTEKRWKTLMATIGLRDGAADIGSAVFTVQGDGKVLYKSPILRAGQQETIEVDISGVNRLRLLTAGGEDHVHHSWAIWCQPKLTR